ncbi:MAG: hypothetical protein A2W03_14445 [Candidatus Aminicenantes bacterium RBG_16_63_16]|nr:MAG: hypothetical protein A2W03_14445 [Candidatus Aminicenantes bacterium RBG_16_63_16]
MPVSLAEWLTNGWLIEHKTSREEIQHLLRLADRDLTDCRNQSLSVDWCFNIAYNAALQCASAALAAAGYRAAKDAHHFRVIQSLKFTIGTDDKEIQKLDAFRKKRNISEYDRAGSISETELSEMIGLSEELRITVEAWIAAKFPRLGIR